MILKNKRAVMHVSIVIFTIATLVLVIAALVAFNVKKTDSDETINSGVELQNVYVRAEIIDFYLREVSSKSYSVDSFKIIFKRLIDDNGNYIIPEFLEIAKQIDEAHIQIRDKKIKINFEFKVSYSSDLYQVDYLDKFSYERALN